MMSRQLRRAFYSITRNVNLIDLPKYVGRFVVKNWETPLLEDELDLESQLLSMHDGKELFHGGLVVLDVGDLLLPSIETAVSNHGRTDAAFRRGRVYATPVLAKARFYAGSEGRVYRISLNGKIGVDFLDVRALSLILKSPQFREIAAGISQDDAVRACMQVVPVALTGDTATVLEVHP